MSDVAQVLRKARDLYAANPSHAPSGTMPALGTYCIATAIRCTGAHGVVEDRAFEAIQAVIRTHRTVSWNAENSTETVLAAFDKAITEADNA